MYQFWPWYKIILVSVKQEHIIAEIFPYSIWLVIFHPGCTFLQVFSRLLGR